MDAIHLNRATLAEGRFNPAAERRSTMRGRIGPTSRRSAKRGSGRWRRPGGCGGAGRGLGPREPLVAALATGRSARRRAAAGVGLGGGAESRPGRLARPSPRSRGVVGTAPPWPRWPGPRQWRCSRALPGRAGERLHDLGGDGTAFLARVQQEHPEDFWAALTLARALQEGADPEAAVAPYLTALELRRDAAAVYNNLGLIPYARRDWHEAYDYYQKALEIDRDFAPAHNNFGLACKGEGKWDVAVHNFREAVRLDTDLAPAHYNLGEIRAYQGGLDEAITPLSAGPPDRSRVRPGRVHARRRPGRQGPAGRSQRPHRRALRDDPAGAPANNNICGYARHGGSLLYNWALLIDPNFIPSRNNLALTPRDADGLDEAIGHYEKAVQIEPGLFREMRHWARRCWAWGVSAMLWRPRRRCRTGSPKATS